MPHQAMGGRVMSMKIPNDILEWNHVDQEYEILMTKME